MPLLIFSRHVLFCLALAGISALVVRAAIDARVMDRPNARSAHTMPTPKGGGIGIVTAFMLGIAMLYGFAEFSRIADPYFRGVILAALAIAVVSFIDDLRDWPFVVKLAAQIGAAVVAVLSGLSVHALSVPYWGSLPLGLFGPAATVLFVVYLTNAMNFMDGLNGLAAGVTITAALFLALIAEIQSGWFVYFSSMVLAASVLGFLPFNFPRARIFMGDVGSQFCGFMLAMLGVAAGRFERVEMSLLLVPMLLNGILFDVTFTLIRRAINGDRITQAHRSHLYQIAHRSGMDPRWIAMLHWGFAALGGLVALAFIYSPGEVKPALPLLLVLPQIVWLGYVVMRARSVDLGRW
jgi:UDP-GlcNAc:undecaprenyl-phosphate/decaprenyl-phosphate GlcNAc-1-phosphate transferase